MKNKITFFTIVLFVILYSNLMNAAEVEISSSSCQGQFIPAFIMDNNFQTRWSSEFSDDQWVQVLYNEPIDIVGLKIYWETAYGRDYDIELKKPDGKWVTKNQIRYADGGVDEIYFGQQTITGFKIVGKKRGTGWGYSIWEIVTIGPENKINIVSNSQVKEHPAQLALDGDPDTYWQSDITNKNQTILELTLPQRIQIGGFRIEWAGENSFPCAIQVLMDDSLWKTIMNKREGLSSTEDLFFKSLEVQKIRFFFLPIWKNL